MRWVHTHRGLTVLIVVVAIGGVGAWLSRRGGDPRSVAAASTSIATSAAIESGGSAGSPPLATTAAPSAADQASRLDVPVDPSGARLVQDQRGARQSAIDYVSTVKQRVLY